MVINCWWFYYFVIEGKSESNDLYKTFWNYLQNHPNLCILILIKRLKVWQKSSKQIRVIEVYAICIITLDRISWLTLFLCTKLHEFQTQSNNVSSLQNRLWFIHSSYMLIHWMKFLVRNLCSDSSSLREFACNLHVQYIAKDAGKSPGTYKFRECTWLFLPLYFIFTRARLNQKLLLHFIWRYTIFTSQTWKNSKPFKRSCV